MPPIDCGDQLGDAEDWAFLQEGRWLRDSAVLYTIVLRAGRYWVSMLFVDSRDPLRFFRRPIHHYPTLHSAQQHASILQRAVRRDSRGTIQLPADAFHLCLN